MSSEFLTAFGSQIVNREYLCKGCFDFSQLKGQTSSKKDV